MPDPWRAALALVALCVLLSLPQAPESLSACAQPGWADFEARRIACDDPEAPPLQGPERRLFALPIDLNAADAETLASLPGIGPGRAAAIVAQRPFGDVSELRRVPGIGRRLLAGIRPLVGVGVASRAAAPENR